MLETLQSKPFSDHFWKLRCRQSARRCGAKHISKRKVQKNEGFGPLLDVQMSKKCARETHCQVKSVKKLKVSDHLLTFRCRRQQQQQQQLLLLLLLLQLQQQQQQQQLLLLLLQLQELQQLQQLQLHNNYNYNSNFTTTTTTTTCQLHHNYTTFHYRNRLNYLK